ncbi:unnamed protein product [Sphagnum balticum]
MGEDVVTREGWGRHVYEFLQDGWTVVAQETESGRRRLISEQLQHRHRKRTTRSCRSGQRKRDLREQEQEQHHCTSLQSETRYAMQTKLENSVYTPQSKSKNPRVASQAAPPPPAAAAATACHKSGQREEDEEEQ